MSLNSTILSVTRRTVNGFTVGEIFDRVQNKLGSEAPKYSTVRARVYELAQAAKLRANGVRRDRVSGRESTTFVRS